MKTYTYVLRTCDKDLRASYNDFQYPVSGIVKCPDWDPKPECGNGLHGLARGEGDVSLLSASADASWLVIKVLDKNLIKIDKSKVKFSRGRVVFVGARGDAANYIARRHPSAAVCYATITAGNLGTATAGYGGTANAGKEGTATAGKAGTATAGYGGTATAGEGGTATAGDWGRATAGEGGTIQLRYFNETTKRYRTVTGYVGEDGIEAGQTYALDDQHKFIGATV